MAIEPRDNGLLATTLRTRDEVEQLTDRYEDALRELIEEKKRGHKIMVSEERRDVVNVVDLMEALKCSIAGQKAPKSALKKGATVSKLPTRRAR